MGLIERELAHNPARYTTVGGNRSRRPWRVKAAWATVLERERRSSMCRNSMEWEAAIEFMGYEEAVRCIGADLAHAASGDDPKMPWLIRDDGPITVREDGAHAKMVGFARPTAAAAVPRHATEKYRGGLKRTATWRPRPAEEDTDEEEQEVENEEDMNEEDMNEEVGTCGICGARFTRGDGYGCTRCMSDSDD